MKLASDSGSPVNGFSSRPDFLIHEQCGIKQISLFFSMNNMPVYGIHEINVQEIKDVRNGLKNYAMAIHSIVNNTESYLPRYDKAPFEKFQKYSNKLFNLIFGKNKEFLERLIHMSDKNSSIYISSDLLAIPYEFINVGQIDEEGNSDLDLFVNYFRMTRFISNGKENFDSDDSTITNIDFSFACQEELESTEQELNFFDAFNSDESKKFKVIERIKSINDFFKLSRPIDFNIFHISCHFEYISENPTNSYLEFAEDFRIHLIDFEDSSIKNIWKNKILIANVCDSGAPLYERESNIAEHFFMTGIDLLVCTGIEIYDKFAGEFTEKFYSNLLNAKDVVSLQEILYETANYFWLNRKDPLGFFYFSIGPFKTFSFN